MTTPHGGHQRSGSEARVRRHATIAQGDETPRGQCPPSNERSLDGSIGTRDSRGGRPESRASPGRGRSPASASASGGCLPTVSIAPASETTAVSCERRTVREIQKATILVRRFIRSTEAPAFEATPVAPEQRGQASRKQRRSIAPLLRRFQSAPGSKRHGLAPPSRNGADRSPIRFCLVDVDGGEKFA